MASIYGFGDKIGNLSGDEAHKGILNITKIFHRKLHTNPVNSSVPGDE